MADERCKYKQFGGRETSGFEMTLGPGDQETLSVNYMTQKLKKRNGQHALMVCEAFGVNLYQ
jgi:hypothetical protein